MRLVCRAWREVATLHVGVVDVPMKVAVKQLPILAKHLQQVGTQTAQQDEARPVTGINNEIMKLTTNADNSIE